MSVEYGLLRLPLADAHMLANLVLKNSLSILPILIFKHCGVVGINVSIFMVKFALLSGDWLFGITMSIGDFPM